MIPYILSFASVMIIFILRNLLRSPGTGSNQAPGTFLNSGLHYPPTDQHQQFSDLPGDQNDYMNSSLQNEPGDDQQNGGAITSTEQYQMPDDNPVISDSSFNATDTTGYFDTGDVTASDDW